MKSYRNVFKWTGMAFLFAALMSFTFVLPSVFAQEGDSTPTPSETPPLPEVTPEPLEIPAIEQESGFQSLMSLSTNPELGGDWAAQVNISDTDEESFKPKIAADNSGNLHIIWRETINGKQEIYYSWIDVDKTTQSLPVNVSRSPFFNSDSPQLVVDSAGIAHIVWQEEDNDHADDYETQYSRCQIVGNEQTGYSATCSTPTTLSDGQACGSFAGDWKATDPSIGIDGNDNLMVAWMSFEPNPRLYTMFSLWSASGSPPSDRTGCNLATGSYYYPVVAGDSNGDFHMLRMNASNSIFYSKYSGGSWSANQTIGTGWLPVIHIDSNDKLHAAWWNTNAPPKYRSKESVGTTWSAIENVFNSTICSDLSLITDEDNLPRLACAAGSVYESSRQASGWTETVIIQSMASQPDLVKDSNDGLHLVWSDSRSGSWDTFYSPTYTCEGITPATAAGQAVLGKIQSIPFLNYCKNQVDEIIYVPALNGENDPNEAFQEWADLARSAQYEVAFTVMFWDRRGDTPYPGETVLTGIQQLYDEVTDEASENKYPHGMKVRILLGVRNNFQDFPWPDQRHVVLRELQNLNIPIYEPLSNGQAWKVEVAVYRDGLQFGVPPGTFSHVKLMVVDNNKMIVSGYHPQYGFQTIGANAENHDLGVKVLGPIAANGMAVFDSLWEGSEIWCTEEDAPGFDTMDIGDCDGEIAENPTHWFFIPEGEDIVLPLFRACWKKGFISCDDQEKTADAAVGAAIESADTQIYVLQNRFGVPGYYDPPLYAEGGLLEYASAILNNTNNPEVRIVVSQESANLRYNANSIVNFLRLYQGDKNIVKVYAPDGYTANPPGLHTKSFMIDKEFLVIGSQNFDHSAFGDNWLDLDLVEYSLGIENSTVISEIADSQDSYFESIWDNSGKVIVVAIGESLENAIQEAQPGDVILIERDIFEIFGTVNIPEGITLAGMDATIVPAPNFSSEASNSKLAKPALQTAPAPLLRINGSNVTLTGLTIQDSPGYAIEIGIGALENIRISNTVFENNALGGVHVQGSANYTIENNTFVSGNSGIALNVNSNSTGVIRNNISTGQDIAPIQIVSADDGTVEYSYNLFNDCGLGDCDANWVQGNMSASSSVHDSLFDVDPLFVNPAIANYRLYPNSPAIDMGDPTILHEFLFDGNGDDVFRIDIGAFEYGIIPNVAPVVNAGDDQTVNFGNSVTINVAYSDADTPDGHFARIDWGDGNIEDVLVTPTSPNAGEVIGEHTYSDEGNYIVEVCATDLYGAVGCDIVAVAVTVREPVNLYLHGSGANANPSTLYFDFVTPENTSAKYKDSTAVNFNNGNPWKEIGTWTADPVTEGGSLSMLEELRVWLGLKNSDDIGTRFDLRAEVYKNGELIASGETLCITGLVRNANQAKEVFITFEGFDPTTLNTGDVLSMRVLTRIGTDGLGNLCGGHSNAVGLRLYFDSQTRPAKFGYR